MNNLRPGQIAVLVGGVLIFISTFIDWFGSGRFGANAYDGDIFGFTGILLLLLALDLAVVTAIRAFAPQVNLPEEILGFSTNELALMLGFAAFCWGLSISVIDGSKSGAVLCLFGGLVALVGAFLEINAEGAPASGDAQPI